MVDGARPPAGEKPGPLGHPDAPGESTATPYGPERPAFAPRPRPPLIERVAPVTAHLQSYERRRYLRPDLLAGVTVAALAIPSGMAYAEVAGLSPVAGLYALLLPAVAYALLGSSRQLVVGPEAALALLVASVVAPMADGDPGRYATLAAMLALLTGGVYLVAFVARLGWIADYFSRAVLVGYIHGIVIVLVIGQLGKLLGLSIDAADPIPQLAEVVQDVDQTSLATLAVGITAIVSLVLVRRFVPSVPAPLVVVVGGIAASGIIGLADHGVATVGDIPAGLPTVVFPSVGLDDLARLAPAAVALFCVGYADGVLTARSFAGRHGQSVRANQEILALGAANAAAGLTQSFAVGASGSRTAVSDQTGGRTQLVGIISAAAIALVLLFLTEPVELLPKAVLGAVIVIAALGLIALDQWRAVRAAGPAEVAIAAVTTFGVVAVGVLWGLLVAVGLSILHATSRSARPHDAVLGWVQRLGRYADASTHPSAQITPAVVVYRLDDRLFFANAAYVRARILEALIGATTRTRWLVFDAEGVSTVDSTGTEMLEQLIDQLATMGTELAVARAKGPLLEALEAAGLTDRIGATNLYPNIEAAVVACARKTEPA
jgi:high affinity sulfate transporter 1